MTAALSLSDTFVPFHTILSLEKRAEFFIKAAFSDLIGPFLRYIISRLLVLSFSLLDQNIHTRNVNTVKGTVIAQ